MPAVQLMLAALWLVPAALMTVASIVLLIVSVVRTTARPRAQRTAAPPEPPGKTTAWPWLDVAAVVLALGVPACCAVALSSGRARLLEAMRGTFAERLALGVDLEAELMMTFLAAPLVLVTAVASAFAVGLSVARRRATPPLLSVAVPVAFVVLGLGPLLSAVLYGALRLASRLVALNDLTGAERANEFAQVMAEDAARLALGFQLSCAGVVIAAVFGLAAAWWHGRRRASAQTSSPLPRRSVVVGSGALFAAAAAAVALAAPMRRENRLSWAPPSSSVPLSIPAETPLLDGPDPVELAPVVLVDSQQIHLDGRRLDIKELGETLTLLRNNFALLQPNDEFNGQLSFVCSPDVPGARLESVFRTILEAGYPNVLLRFVKPEGHQRPSYGTLRRLRSTAARVKVVSFGGALAPDLVAIAVADGTSYAEVAREAVEARRKGLPVALVIPP